MKSHIKNKIGALETLKNVCQCHAHNLRQVIDLSIDGDTLKGFRQLENVIHEFDLLAGEFHVRIEKLEQIEKEGINEL